MTEATERQFHEDVAALGALAADHRAARHRIYRHDAGDDRAARRPRRRLCRRGSRAVLALRDGCAALGAALRDARPPLARRDAGRRARRRRALQARSDGLRLVEAIEAQRARAGQALPASLRRGAQAGISSARRCRWRRCSNRSAAVFHATTRAATFSTSTAAGSISSSLTTRTRSRNPARLSFLPHGQCLDAQRLPAGRRREDVEEPRQLRHHSRIAPHRNIWSAEPGQATFCASPCFERTIDDPIDWTVRELVRADRELREWYQERWQNFASGTIDAGVLDALSDDLNTHVATLSTAKARGAR